MADTIPKPRARGRPRADDAAAVSRDAILCRALELFAAVGYQGFSLRELARDLGVSHGLINVRFGSKDDLWRACVEWGLAHLAERLDATPRTGPIEERFRHAVIQTLLAIEAVPPLLQLVNHEAATESARLAFLTETIIEDRYAVLEDIVREGIRQGKFRDVPPHMVFLLVAHGGGAVFTLKPLSRRLGLLSTADGNEIRTQAAEIAEFALRGIAVSAIGNAQ
ncbi:MAG: TetR/AcrR family transcriptional regulator [Pseudomonadota bacterium]